VTGGFCILGEANKRPGMLSVVLRIGWCRRGVPGSGELVPDVGGVETRSKDNM
jgi:hypothetical protein